MQIVIDLDTRKPQRSLTDSRTATQFDFKRGDDAIVEILFVRGGVQTQLTAGIGITFGVKVRGRYDSLPLVQSNDFTLSGSGATAKYIGYPSFNTEELNEALGIDDDESNDIAVLDLMGEISWTEPTTEILTSSETFAVRVANDVNREDDAPPNALPSPEDWLDARAVRFDKSQTLTDAQKQSARGNIDAMPEPIILDAEPVDGALPTSINITGTLTDGTANVTFPALYYQETDQIKPLYSAADGGVQYCYWNVDLAQFRLVYTAGVSEWASTADVYTPDLVPAGAWHATTNPHAWKPVSPATGTPALAAVGAITGTAAQAVGQLVRVGTAAPYAWHRVQTLSPNTFEPTTPTIAEITGLSDALAAKQPLDSDLTAYANAADAAARRTLLGIPAELTAAKDRSNHTGTQAVSTITGLQTALDEKADDGAVFYADRYGVLADGTTNDTAALQAAIDAASAVATPIRRATVVLPSGLIRLGRSALHVGSEIHKEAIELKSNVNIVGQGLGSTVLKLLDNVTSNCPVMLAPTGNSANIAISDLTIDGNAVTRLGAAAGGEDEGVNFKTGTNILLTNLRITNCGQDAIDLDAGNDITIIGCTIDSNFGNGVHNFGGGPMRVKVIGCHFLSNGFQRRASDGAAGSGSGIDNNGGIQISDCTFLNNVVEVQTTTGNMLINNCSISHGGGGATLSAILIGNTGTASGPSASCQIYNCQIRSFVASAIEIVNGFARSQIQNNRLGAPESGTSSGVLATNAGRIFMSGNDVTAFYGIFLVSTAAPAFISGNLFAATSNGVRVENSVLGVCSANLFVGLVSDIQLRSGSTGWRIVGNTFSSTTAGVQSVAGGGGSAKILGNAGGFDLSLGSTNAIVKGNELDAVTLQTGGATGNVFEENTISGAITHTTATFASNTWRRNTGAGCVGVFYGTATLASGAATVATAAANSARKWSLTRQGKGSSTAIGSLSVGTITAQTNFAIDALKADATTETGDLSSVYWEIIE